MRDCIFLKNLLNLGCARLAALDTPADESAIVSVVLSVALQLLKGQDHGFQVKRQFLHPRRSISRRAVEALEPHRSVSQLDGQ
jgi:hypothetical protein